jgi:hypothetical protein
MTEIRTSLTLAMGLAAVLAAPAVAQQTRPVDVTGEVFVNTPAERYLRDLQLVGAVPLHPWSLRAFQPAEVDALAPTDTVHPWSGAYDFRAGSGGQGFRIVRPRGGLIVNSALPGGEHTGAVWAGRGVTASVSGGIAWRGGPLWITLAPVAFIAQNADFELLHHAASDSLPLLRGPLPFFVDAPQRFGDASYARIDPGQSSAGLSVGPVAVALSTANLHWGPAAEHPLVMGSNAAGFPHLSVGTAGPVDVGVGRLNARLVWGSLAQSPFASSHPDSMRRFAPALVAVFEPRFVPGLEVGGARFFHSPWPREGLTADHFLRPLEGLLKSRLRERPGGVDALSDVDNQLGSVFARWVAPRSGFEAYGEYAREDHSYDLRDVILQPDHASAYMIGAARAWRTGPERLVVLRAEVVNAEISHIDQSRGQAPFYVHTGTRQGHTHRGEFLGTPAAFGGSGTVLRLDRFTPGARLGARFARDLLGETRQPGIDLADALRVRYSLGADFVAFRGRTEWHGGAAASTEMNRTPGRGSFNLHLRAGAAVALP